MRQSDISRELGVDKSTTFRWFEGSLPAEKHLLALSDLFVCEVTDLFRHPDDDWMARFLRERKGDYTDDDREKLRSLVDLVFPKKVA